MQSDFDYDDYVFIEPAHHQLPIVNQILAPLPTPVVVKKKLLWQLDYKSVPYYIRAYNRQLFVCDKYG